MSQITTVGVDLAKAVIVVCAADADGHVQFFKQLSFNAFGQWAATLPPCGTFVCTRALRLISAFEFMIVRRTTLSIEPRSRKCYKVFFRKASHCAIKKQDVIAFAQFSWDSPGRRP